MTENEAGPPATDQADQKPEKWHAKPIDRDQIEAALGLLDQLYPIGDTPATVAYPALGYICCCLGTWSPGKIYMNEAKKTDEEQPLNDQGKNAVTLNGKQQKVKTKDSVKSKAKLPQGEAEKDPFIQLGTGMVAYRDLLYTFIWMFFLFSILSIPALYAFRQFKAYQNVPESLSGYEKFSLGNMGYSTTQCGVVQRDVGALAMTCPYGFIGTLQTIGVNPPNTSQTACVASESFGNQNCAANQAVSPIAQNITAAAQEGDVTHLLFDVTIENIYGTDIPTDQACLDDDAFFYAQFECIQTYDDMVTKYHILCVVTTIGVFIALLYLLCLRNLRKQTKIQRLEWDLSTVTAADYTVEMKIDKKAYLKWREEVYNAPDGPFTRGVAPMTAYKNQMIEEIEQNLTEALARNRAEHKELKKKSKKKQKEAAAEDIAKIQVSDIIFAFDNAKMIKLLQQRGKAILNLKFDKMREKEKQIDHLVDTEFKKLTEPVDAFIIFEEEDGILIALEESKKESFQLIGQQMKFKQATEPTNIIWENRHFNDFQRLIRGIIVFVITVILLALSFWAIVVTQKAALSVDSTFPPTTDCTEIQNSYGSNLQTFAGYEWYSYTQNHKAYLPGALQCFCEQQLSDKNSSYSTVYSNEYEITLYPNGPTEDEQICRTYLRVVTVAYGLSESLAYAITTINYVLRVIVIAMITRIGFATESDQLSWVTTGVFLTQFFNTAFLLLLVNADLSPQPNHLRITSGQLSDFNMAWYNSIGNDLVGTILFTAYWPLVEFFLYWFMRLAFRCLDRGCNSCDKYKTKKTSLWQYTFLYAGPEYFMHYKYSTVLNVTFCVFMYGFGLPLLFPVAFLAFVILYFMEKSMLYWSYRLPPMYDESLNNSVLNKLEWAPVFYFVIGYWMLASDQLISNDNLFPKEHAKNATVTGKQTWMMFHGEGWILPAWPFLVLFWIWILYLTIGEWVWSLVIHYFPSMEIGDVEINEDIDNYYKALDDEDRIWTVKEEENCRNVLGMRCLPEEAFERFKYAISSDATIEGVHTYDILANPLYTDSFQYFSAAIPDREMYIVDDDDDESNDNAQSDMVRAALNLAYMTEDKAITFSFDKDTFRIRRASTIDEKTKNMLNNTRSSEASQKRDLLLLPQTEPANI